MVKIEIDNVAAREIDANPGFCIGRILRKLSVSADVKMLDVPYQYPIFDGLGGKVGTMTVDDNPPEQAARTD